MAAVPSFNLADLFESVADAVPERTALVSVQRRLSFAELDERATRLANCWRQRGIGRGDHVGLQLYNGSEYLEGMLAAYKLGAVAINVNYNYVEGELRYLFKDADLVAVVCHQAFAPRVGQVRDDCPKLRHVFCVADDSAQAVDSDFIDYETALADSSDQRDFPARDSDDLYIVYTGGTTGMPKGVMWHHRDIFFAAMGGGDLDQSRGPINSPEELPGRIMDMAPAALPAPPFMHAAAQWAAMSLLFAGGKIVIAAGGRFDPAAIWRSVDEEQVNMLILVGDAMATPLAEALEEAGDAVSAASLLAIASGGALFSPATKERLVTLLPNAFIVDGLGSSETGVMGNKVNVGDGGEREPLFMVNADTQVLDDDNRPVSPGSATVGHIARRGHVPIGYYNAPEKSANTFLDIDGQRWAIPGDLATVAEDGRILLLGRGSVSINTGGEKVFPEEVEAAVKEHPAVRDAVVVGSADERFGEQVVAVCQLCDGTNLAIDELRDFCRERLAGYKIPRALVCLDVIKRSPAGKADYPWAREQAERELNPAKAG